MLATLPAAQAISTEGQLTLMGPISFTSPAEATIGAVAFVDNDAGSWGSFRLDAPSVEACVFETRYAEAHAADVQVRVPLTQAPSKECVTYSSVKASRAENSTRDGWAGFHSTGISFASISTRSGFEAREDGILASFDAARDSTEAANSTAEPYYHYTVTSPHLHVKPEGALSLDGEGCLKFKGPDVILTAEGKSVYYETSDSAPSGVSGREVVVRWLVLCFGRGSTLTIHNPGALQVAATEATRISWEGNALLVHTGGMLRTPHGEYVADEAQAGTWIEGSFTGRLAPLEGGSRMVAYVTGDMTSTTLRFVPAPSTASGGFSWLWLGLLVGAFVVTGGGVIATVTHRALRRTRLQLKATPAPMPPPRATETPEVRMVELAETYRIRAEEAIMRAEEEADCGAWLKAADLFRVARRLDPSMPGLALEEAICWHKAGDYAQAIEAYEAAALESDDGEAEQGAADAALDRGLMDAALTYALRALDRNPSAQVVSEFYSEMKYAPLHEDRTFAHALEEAWKCRPFKFQDL